MAAELVGGAFLSAALQVVFDRLGPTSTIYKYFRSRKLEGRLLRNLNNTLISVNQVLDDAEARQYTNSNVKKWVQELKHAVYVADDLLDEIATEATRLKIEAENQTDFNKVRGCLTAADNPFDKHMETRIQEVLDDLKSLVEQKDFLGLKESSVGGSEVGVGARVSSRLPTTSLVADESRIYGRDGDEEEIIRRLLDEDLSRDPLSVISVVGMGGSGKTTLAQLVYNDGRIKDQFQLKAWVCISEEFDVLRITKTVLSALECPITGYEDLNQLQLKLKEKLTGKKFFLVFDDVWNERHSNWDSLRVPFCFGASGSKILVTTRSEKVASVMASIRVHHITLLNEEDGWKLFAEYAFKNKDANSCSNLQSIGKKIVEKCKGLPLAIKSLGGLLHTKFSEKYWNEILDSEIWQLADGDEDIMPALRLSYHYLPSNLKRCFAFCSIFPKDFQIDKESLIQMWMAEDLIYCNQGNKSVEELGNGIVDELESRSFVEKSTFSDDKLIMHDLVNDLAKSVSGGFCLRMEVDKVQNEIIERIRYCSFSSFVNKDDEISLEPICESKQLRCFAQLRKRYSATGGKVEAKMFSRFRHLRILGLNSVATITKLSDGISNLKHLRYLDLSDSGIEKLPDSICTMCNLQTLKLNSCGQIVELPQDLYKLINLHYLDLSNSGIEKLPGSICTMCNLQTLKLDSCGEIVEIPQDLYKLINLHYLDLSRTGISELPDSICKVRSLQTLKLQGCGSLAELPPDLPNLINLRHLDLVGTCIREMPMNMGRMKHLQGLTSFVVGKQSGSNIRELGELNCLQGSLEILKLDNISDPMDAGGANMKEKNYLNELTLGWSGNNEDSQNERSVLEALQPHINLKRLVIKNYGGTRFADWMNAPYLPNVVSLELRACKYCFCLPPLGQLPSLEWLHISHLEGIKELGSEFYGENLSIAPFPSLEYLIIENMGELEEWKHFEGECFPRLEYIRILSCPKLRKSLPLCLPCLEWLDIGGCEGLELESFPMKDSSYPKLICITLAGMTQLKSLHEDMHARLPCLRELTLRSCPQLQLVPQRGFPSSLVLFNIRITSCPKLMACRMSWGLQGLHSLKQLQVGDHDFENAESFLEEQHLPPNLTKLHLVGCSNLTKINNNGLLCLTSLRWLWIEDCPNLECLPEEGLPNSLSSIWISGNSPLLKQRYQKVDGPGWHKISHIPDVRID
ncbi:putative disease resistance RPP13-like protein 1 [Prosopis cineraria]|uniref:putative disease resistance RPP13-like protein 1 n=1 Tax=Prosopis cineraria TaxID=364024 RepID=UPI00240F0F4A|nr:putative disease resistance RPP13-like protein 1 [Prosopis cineraria]XP_054811909.1 putative disease resistance RPP13-like protein 1 [Prosopis cineraria]XP_054811911.1 putative disease resistance RPP13-like protein 1 [Prosopis cineraria]XP_054811912.1 putative disease resistance RPP13-like protein 1 [Prosopis cineraria]XP_054811913.1 putative disease resistance RPP13-like protein 1 [Prosopis cineraria]XP_054811914.1 putative disease resistance RPP13-like protein 1 [Prosopis cineraria]XP_05